MDSFHLKPKITPSAIKLKAYNGSPIGVVGKFVSPIEYRGKKHKVLLIVVDSDSMPILGLKACERLNLIKRVNTVNPVKMKSQIKAKYSDCFGEIGCLDKVHHIEMKENVKPVVMSARKVPIALKKKLKSELDRMEKLGCIRKVEEPADWVNGMVLVEKPNKSLRVCLDPRPLNEGIKRQHLQLPTKEEMLSKLTGAKYFTKLDASSGYWQIKVDDESAGLLTFATPFGRYQFLRLPFGIHSLKYL